MKVIWGEDSKKKRVLSWILSMVMVVALLVMVPAGEVHADDEITDFASLKAKLESITDIYVLKGGTYDGNGETIQLKDGAYIYISGDVTLKNMKFDRAEKNYSVNNTFGASFLVGSSNVFKMENVTVSNVGCIAPSAVSIEPRVILKDCSFINNSGNGAGAVNVNYGMVLIADGCFFYSNNRILIWELRFILLLIRVMNTQGHI